MIATVLTAAFSAMLINSLFGKRLQFVTLLSISFVISNILLAIATVVFTKFQTDVITNRIEEAQNL